MITTAIGCQHTQKAHTTPWYVDGIRSWHSTTCCRWQALFTTQLCATIYETNTFVDSEKSELVLKTFSNFKNRFNVQGMIYLEPVNIPRTRNTPGISVRYKLKEQGCMKSNFSRHCALKHLN